MTTDSEPRVFRLPLGSITMSERRILARQFGINWDAVEVDLSDIPRPTDPTDPTDAEKRAAAKAFVTVVGPNERFALLWLAARRELPKVTESDVEAHADAGDWILDLTPAADDTPAVEDGADAPLPPPTSNSGSS